MSQQIDAPTGSFKANAALTHRKLVKLNSSRKLALNAVGISTFTGVTLGNQPTADAHVSIKFKKAPGTFICTADGVIAAGASIYAAASGKVSTSVSGSIIGIALEAATADGSEIECDLY